jgi:hypothetical protein
MTVKILERMHRGSKLEVRYADGTFTFRHKVGRSLMQPLVVHESELPEHPYDVQQYIIQRLGPLDLQDLNVCHDYGSAAQRAVAKVREQLRRGPSA